MVFPALSSLRRPLALLLFAAIVAAGCTPDGGGATPTSEATTAVARTAEPAPTALATEEPAPSDDGATAGEPDPSATVGADPDPDPDPDPRPPRLSASPSR